MNSLIPADLRRFIPQDLFKRSTATKIPLLSNHNNAKDPAKNTNEEATPLKGDTHDLPIADPVKAPVPMPKHRRKCTICMKMSWIEGTIHRCELCIEVFRRIAEIRNDERRGPVLSHDNRLELERRIEAHRVRVTLAMAAIRSRQHAKGGAA